MGSRREEEFSIYFWSGNIEEEHMHQDVELIFVIDGKLTVSMLEKRFVLQEEDVLVINSNHRHGFVAAGHAHVCVIHFNYTMLLEYQNTKLVFFYCNSAVEKHEKYVGLRSIMGNLLSECAVNMDKMTYMKKSQVYRLLHYLVQYFMSDHISDNSGGDDVRVEKMLQYINANYNKMLTLGEMAEFMYMAPSSFSRYFKKRVGITFIEYVNNVRLHFALEDVCYTDKPIAWIAQNHGFTNSSAFCRAFKDLYQVSPMIYRKQGRAGEMEKKTAAVDRNVLKKYVRKTEMSVWQPWKKKNVDIRGDAAKLQTFDNPWGDSFYLGTAHLLRSAVLQQQVLFTKKEMNFTYGKISGIFSKKMGLRPGHENKIFNYDNLDLIFDFLVENNIRPIICLDNKPEGILKSVNEDLLETESEKIFETIDECLAVLDDFLAHIISRYGTRVTELWMFECWYDEYYENTMGIPGSFTKHFTRIFQCIRRRLANASVGGCGLSPAISDRKFNKLVGQWKLEPCEPDFISIYLLPYVRADINGKRHARRRPNTDYVLEDIEGTRKIMAAHEWSHIPVRVLEWNLSVSERNYFNDSCGKAAQMISQMCCLIGKVSFAAYGNISDFSSSYYDAGRLLIGAGGLLSRSGICKPSFYGIKFMRMLEPLLIQCGEHSIITTNGKGSYTLLCFNHKNLRYNYYIKDEYHIGLEDVNNIFEDDDRLDLTFTLENAQSGKYSVNEYGLSPEKGNILEEWKNLGAQCPVSLENIQYLRSICVPYQKNGSISASDG